MDHPAARWGFELEPDGGGTLLRQWAVLGASSAGRTLDELDLQVPVAVEFTDDVAEAEMRHAAKTNLLSTPAMIRDRLRLYRDAGVRTLQVKLGGELPERLDTLGQFLDLVRDFNQRPNGWETSGRERPERN